MVLRRPEKAGLRKFLEHVLLVLKDADNAVLRSALHVNWNANRPALAVREDCLKDATLATIPKL